MKKVIALLALIVATSSQAQWNLSTRGWVGAGERCLIAGFIVGGSEFNVVVIRALGPTLANYNVASPLVDPCLQLHNADGDLLWTQDTYLENSAENLAFLQSKGLIPPDTHECAIVWPVTTGNYTVILRGMWGVEGMALLEVYYYKI